jgi:uncharacterized membrane protein YfcA
MSTFWELVKESVITQSILTVLLWSAVVYLAVTGQAIPDLLSIAATSVLGFWFGSKVSYTKAINQAELNTLKEKDNG